MQNNFEEKKYFKETTQENNTITTFTDRQITIRRFYLLLTIIILVVLYIRLGNSDNADMFGALSSLRFFYMLIIITITYLITTHIKIKGIIKHTVVIGSLALLLILFLLMS